MGKVVIVPCSSYDHREVQLCMTELFSYFDGLVDILNHKEILIKPNLCLPVSPENAITTHPEVIDSIVQLCKNYNPALKITIGDSPIGKADAERRSAIWNITGMADVAARNTCSIDYMENNYYFREYNSLTGGIRYPIHEVVDNPVNIINVPKFKTHGLMMLSGAVKNLYGLIPDGTKKWLHRRFPNRSDFARLLIDVYDCVNPCLNIVDAIVSLEGEGPGAKGKPKKTGLLLASTCAVSLDFVLAQIMNIDPLSVPTNKAWVERFGAAPTIEVVGAQISSFVCYDYKLPVVERYNNEKMVKKLFDLKYSKPKIDNKKCIGCGLCEKNCSVKAIGFKNSEVIINTDRCIGCLICHEICPRGAVEIKSNEFYTQIADM